MSKAAQLIEMLTSKTHQLIGLYHAEKRGREQMALRNAELEVALAASHAKIGLLEEDIKQLKLANGLLSGTQSGREAKAKINEIVREIDRCIALLNE
jgi:hypothetical protein